MRRISENLQELWDKSQGIVIIFLASVVLDGVWTFSVFEILDFSLWVMFFLIFVPILGVWYIVKRFIEEWRSIGNGC